MSVIFGKTICQYCGSILTKENTYPSQVRNGWRTCIKCSAVKARDWKRKQAAKFYVRIFRILGTKCSICGFSNPRALQIDHIHGGGVNERVKVFRHNREAYLSYLSNLPEKELKDNYRILCANCNWIKKYDNEDNHLGVDTVNIIERSLKDEEKVVYKRHRWSVSGDHAICIRCGIKVHVSKTQVGGSGNCKPQYKHFSSELKRIFEGKNDD